MEGKVIQEWHVVLGDANSAHRTTRATQILRGIKAHCKERYRGKKTQTWMPAAREQFLEQMQQEFPHAPVEEQGLLLLKCTAQTRDRILIPNQYRYPDDQTPTYGVAQANAALSYFFQSREKPSLRDLLKKQRLLCEQRLQNLQSEEEEETGPPPKMVASFQKTLDFFQYQIDQADLGDPLAEKLIDLLKPFNAIKELGSFLKKYRPKVGYVHDDVDKDGANAAEKDYYWKSAAGHNSEAMSRLHAGDNWERFAEGDSMTDDVDMTTPFSDQDKESSPQQRGHGNYTGMPSQKPKQVLLLGGNYSTEESASPRTSRKPIPTEVITDERSKTNRKRPLEERPTELVGLSGIDLKVFDHENPVIIQPWQVVLGDRQQQQQQLQPNHGAWQILARVKERDRAQEARTLDGFSTMLHAFFLTLNREFPSRDRNHPIFLIHVTVATLSSGQALTVDTHTFRRDQPAQYGVASPDAVKAFLEH